MSTPHEDAARIPRSIVRRPRPTVGAAPPRAIVHRRPRGVTPARRARALPAMHLGRTWRIGLLAAAAFAVLALGSVTLWRSPVFEISHVDVAGNLRVPTDVVVEQAAIRGDHIVTADLAAVERALAALPLVQSAHVERDWPKSVRITIVERQTWGTWEQAGVRYSIDREGVVLGVQRAPDGSPVIRSSEPGTRLQGDRVDVQAIDSAAEIYQLLPDLLGTTVTEVAFIAGTGVMVTTEDGQSALFGDSSAISYKLAVWSALAKQAIKQGVNYTTIDLRFGNRPVLQ